MAGFVLVCKFWKRLLIICMQRFRSAVWCVHCIMPDLSLTFVRKSSIEVKADSCSPINSIMEELWKINIFFSSLYGHLTVQWV